MACRFIRLPINDLRSIIDGNKTIAELYINKIKELEQIKSNYPEHLKPKMFIEERVCPACGRTCRGEVGLRNHKCTC